MTREEAKNIVRGITDKIEATTDIDDWAEFWRFTRDDYEEFLEMPIKLLEKEPCEDAISRQSVLEELRTCFDTHTIYDENNGENYIIYEDAVDMMEKLPSVSPTRKKGRWIGHREHCENLGVIPSGLGAYEWCSNCDCGIDVREWHRNHYNYCPNCGAEMESEE